VTRPGEDDLTRASWSQQQTANPEVAEKFERPTLNPDRHAGARINHDHEEAKSNHCCDLYPRGS